MIKKYLLIALSLCFYADSFAQQAPTDDPALVKVAPGLNNQQGSAKSMVPCATPVVTNDTACGSGSLYLTTSSAPSYAWYDSTGALVSDSFFYNTPVLNSTTTYYVEFHCPDTAQIPLPPQSTTLGGNVRGYYFTAPVNFNIDGVRVPLDNTGDQTIEIVRFTAGAPPVYSAVTDSFVSLGYWNSVNSTGIIPANIPVSAGDIIGVYGYRGTTNSYTSSASQATTTIGGQSVNLHRSGMQFSLVSSQMHSIWSEPTSFSISRVELYYSYMDTSAQVPVYAVINPLPQINMVPFDSTVCVNHAPVALPVPSPSGGTWSGTAVTGTTFDPGVAGAGNFTMVYTYTDSLGCTNSDSSATITVDLCAGLEDKDLETGVSIFPNPAAESFVVSLPQAGNANRVVLSDITGRIIQAKIITSSDKRIEFNVASLSRGVYHVTVHSSEAPVTKILIVN